MRTSRPTLTVLIRLAFVTAFSVAVGFTVNAFLNLKEVQNSIRYRIPENTIWAAAQGEIELSRTLSRLAPIAFGMKPEGDRGLTLQFDLLWSRAMIFRTGSLAIQLENAPKEKAVFEQYYAALQKSDGLIGVAAAGDAAAGKALLEVLAPYSDKLRSLTMESLNADRREREKLSSDNDLLQAQLHRFGLASIVLLMLLLSFLILAERRARHLLEDANESRSDLEKARSLSEAQAQRMELLARKATAASGAKTEFLAMMSHDIRTPLNAIIGLSELLLQGKVPGEERRMNGTILRASEGLLTLINDILDMTRLEAGKLPLKPSAFSISALAEEVREVADVLAEANGNRMTVRIDPSLPEMVMGDADRLRQVLLNLTGNANKFTQNGEVHLRFYLLKKGSTDYTVRFAVSDTGSGISKEMRERLFKPFEQGENAGEMRGNSTGLGLAISERLVHLMGGKIQFASEPGNGTIFSFDLDLEHVSEAEECVKVVPSHKHYEASLAGKRVLIADDTPASLMVAVKMFENFGAVIETAECGDDAIALGRNRHFDIVVLDVQMPRTNGVGAMQALRQEGVNANSVYVALTAQSFARDRERLLAAGFDHYVSKPVRLADIARLIEQIEEDRTKPAFKAQEKIFAGEFDATAGSTAGFEASLNAAAAAEAENELDIGFLEDLRDDLDAQVLITLVNQVHNEMDAALPALKISAVAGDHEEVRKIAHKIAGLLEQFGVRNAARSAREIEINPVLEDEMVLLDTLVQQSKDGLVALRKYINYQSDQFNPGVGMPKGNKPDPEIKRFRAA